MCLFQNHHLVAYHLFNYESTFKGVKKPYHLLQWVRHKKASSYFSFLLPLHYLPYSLHCLLVPPCFIFSFSFILLFFCFLLPTCFFPTPWKNVIFKTLLSHITSFKFNFHSSLYPLYLKVDYVNLLKNTLNWNNMRKIIVNTIKY